VPSFRRPRRGCLGHLFGRADTEPVRRRARDGREAPAVDVDAEGHRVIELRREEYKNEEISTITGWSLRKVQRFLEKLRPTFLN